MATDPKDQTSRNALILNAGLLDGARSKRIHMVEAALDMGADANAVDDFGMTAMHFAANANDVRMIKVLMQYGARIGNSGKEGLSPFCSAALSGRLDAMKLLSFHAMDLEQFRSGNRTMLEMAFIAGKMDIAAWLIDKGADMESVDWRGETMITRMAACGNGGAVLLLAESGACVDGDLVKQLRNMGLSALVPKIKRFQKRERAERTIWKGYTVSASKPAGPGLVVDGDGDPEFGVCIMDEEDPLTHPRPVASPSHGMASQVNDRLNHAFGFLSSCAQGLAHAAGGFLKTHLPTASGRSARADRAFIRLLEQGSVAQVHEFLLSRTEPLNLGLRNSEGLTVLQLLVQLITRSCVPSSGISFDGKMSPNERMVLEIACALHFSGDLSRADLHARFPESGNTILHELIEQGHSKMTMHLLRIDMFKVLVNTSNHALHRSLHLAVQRQDPHLMSALVEAGGNLNAFDRRGHTPLHVAAFMLEHPCSETALSLGANIHLPTREGMVLEQILSQRKDQSDLLRSMVAARRTIDSAKSIFSANNPMASAVRGKRKAMGGPKKEG